MIPFYNIIEIFGLANDNRSLVGLVVPLNRCGVTATLVDRDFLGKPLVANRFT